MAKNTARIQRSGRYLSLRKREVIPLAAKAKASVTIADISDGTDGTGIKSTVVEYQAGSSGTSNPTGTWNTSIPPTSASAPYLWTRVTYTYTDGSPNKVVYSVGSTPEGIVVGGRNLARLNAYGRYAGGITFIGEFKNFTNNSYKFTTTGNPNDLIGTIAYGINSDIISINGYSDLIEVTTYYRFYNGKGPVDLQQNKKIKTSSGRFNFNLSVPSGATMLHIGFGQYPYSINYYIENIMIVNGNKATDWTPAPEDVDSKIETAQTTANNAQQNIDSANARIDTLVSRTDSLGQSLSTVTQTADKINWLVKSGTSSTDFTLTDRTAQLITDSLVVKDSTGASTIISGGRMDINQIFAQDITATGTITGANLVGATGVFSDKISISKDNVNSEIKVEEVEFIDYGWSLLNGAVTPASSAKIKKALSLSTDLKMLYVPDTIYSSVVFATVIRAKSAIQSNEIMSPSIYANTFYEGGTALSSKYAALSGATMSGNLTAPSVYTSNWFRSTGATGWYNATYGGGIYMNDDVYVKVYNGKKFACPREIVAGVSESYGQFRAVWSTEKPGFFIRNDGTNTYFMLTDANDAYGTWNSLRPLYINNTTGNVSISKMNIPTKGNSWIGGGMNGDNVSIKISTKQTTDSYHPFLYVQSSGGHHWNIGGIANYVGIYGFYSSQTANTPNYYTRWSTNTGLLEHYGDFNVNGTVHLGTSNQSVYFSGDRIVVTTYGNLRTTTDNSQALGTSDYRWSKVYAVNGTIQTSDEREKDILGEIDDRYLEFFENTNPILYRWKYDDDKRIRIGIGAQSAEKNLISSGLSLEDYAGIDHNYFDKPTDNGLTDRYSMDYTMYCLLAAEQSKRNKKKINSLESELSIYKARSDSLQTQLNEAMNEIAELKKLIKTYFKEA